MRKGGSPRGGEPPKKTKEVKDGKRTGNFSFYFSERRDNQVWGIPLEASRKKSRRPLDSDVPTAATPIVSILMDRTGIPMISPRKDEKTHGIYTAIDGKFQGGQTVLLIDDVLSLADSKLEVIDILRRNNLIVERVLVFLDYEIGGEEKLKEVSCTLQAAIKIGKLLSFCLKEGTISRQQHEEITSTFQAVKTYFCK